MPVIGGKQTSYFVLIHRGYAWYEAPSVTEYALSEAKIAFEAALADVQNLQAFHETVGGTGPGKRPYNLTSLNKSGVVLLCATWEIYVETVVIECTQLHLQKIAVPDLLLKPLSKLVTEFLKREKDDRAWHQVADQGWKLIVKSAVVERVGSLNTPKVAQVSGLFSDLLGVNAITDDWAWHKSSSSTAKTRLDEFVTLRGSIAHGEKQSANVTKATVTSAQDLITRLVEKVEGRLSKEGLI